MAPRRTLSVRELAALRPRKTPGDAVMTIGLTRSLDDLVAVDHLEIAIAHGEVFGLLGRNGAGNTMTSRCSSRCCPRRRGVRGCRFTTSAAIRHPCGG